MPSVAYYRLPRRNSYVVLRHEKDETLEISSFSGLNGRKGFLFAPFAPDEDHPIILIPVDASSVETHDIPDSDNKKHLCAGHPIESTYTEYSRNFVAFHDKLVNGDFSKIVLARYKDVTLQNKPDLEKIFFTACIAYPRMFVSLISTDKSGTWLMATPEVLLEGVDGEWHTMALAGTMKLDNAQLAFDNPLGNNLGTPVEWSMKNRSEQKIVADYIHTQLQSVSSGIDETPPYSSRAANLVHLRSDFSFQIKAGIGLGQVIDTLFPTPAVCGMPKDSTRRFILREESFDREYYSGFAGPVNISGETHLFVTLRCMKADGLRLRFYAGGGIMAESDVDAEWQETENKIKTIESLIY